MSPSREWPSKTQHCRVAICPSKRVQLPIEFEVGPSVAEALSAMLAKEGLQVSRAATMDTGEFYALLPPQDDIHYVKTVSDVPSVSIHLLANDTACVWRHRFEPASGAVTAFRSGYSNAPCPPEDAGV